MTTTTRQAATVYITCEDGSECPVEINIRERDVERAAAKWERLGSPVTVKRHRAFPGGYNDVYLAEAREVNTYVG